MDVVARKLSSLSRLDEADIKILTAFSGDVRTVKSGEDIISEGDNPSFVHTILSGMAFRYKITHRGRRQILAYLLPGDLCDLHVALLDEMDHSIGAMGPCSVASIPRASVLKLADQHPRIARALLKCTLIDEATLREWLVNVSQRPADQRIAHLFCEMHVRMTAVTLVDGPEFSLPMNQSALADTVGLSVVHVNRSLKALREAGLVTFKQQVVTIRDIDRLAEYADFDPTYLHLRQT